MIFCALRLRNDETNAGEPIGVPSSLIPHFDSITEPVDVIILGQSWRSTRDWRIDGRVEWGEESEGEEKKSEEEEKQDDDDEEEDEDEEKE